MSSKYQQFAELLEEELKGGRYGTGSVLPGERTLSEQYSVSRVTIRAGLKLLVEKHLLSAAPGIGYQVIGDGPVISHAPTHLIGGVFAGPQINEAYMYVPFQLSQAASLMMEGRDYNLVLANSGDDVIRERTCLQQLLQRKVEGLLVMPAFTGGAWHAPADDAGNYPYYRKLFQAGLPMVLMDRPMAGDGIPGVYNDNAASGALETEYMLKRGFRQILYLDSANDRIGFLRCSGYQRTMKAAGLVPRQIPLSPFRDTQEWTTPQERHEAELAPLMPLLNQDTALLCSPFLTPALDKRFPKQHCGKFRVEWICCDFKPGFLGQPAQHYPYMTRPIEEIGRRSAEKLLKLIRGEPAEPLVEWLPPKLVP